MKISIDRPDVPPIKPIPCGDPCAQTFWEIASWDDITIDKITRYTLLNYVPSEPVSSDPTPVSVDDYYIKEGSETDIQPENIPDALKQAIKEYFGVGKRKGFLGDYLSCAYPCSCILDDTTRSNEGQEEETLEIDVEYEERREMVTFGMPQGDVPTLNELIDPRTGQRPTGFDTETDEIKKGRIGINGDQRWDIVRTYLAVVKAKIKFDVIIYLGTCLNLDEFI